MEVKLSDLLRGDGDQVDLDAGKMENVTDITTALIENVELGDLKAFIEHFGVDQDKMDQLLKNEVLLGAFLNLQLQEGRSEYVIQILQNTPASINNPDFLHLWDEAHYQKYGNAKAPMSALQKFRIRKRNPPPNRICPSGHRPRNMGRKTKEAQAVLTTWLEEHRNNPYPDKETKRELSERAELSYSQVNNWFANARRTIRKRMRSNISQQRVKQGTTADERDVQTSPIIAVEEKMGDGKHITELSNDLLTVKNEVEQIVAKYDHKGESRHAWNFQDIESNLQKSSNELNDHALLKGNDFYLSGLKQCFFDDAVKMEIQNDDRKNSPHGLLSMMQNTAYRREEVICQILAADREILNCNTTPPSSDTTSHAYMNISSSMPPANREPVIQGVSNEATFKAEQDFNQSYGGQGNHTSMPVSPVQLQSSCNNCPASVTSSNIREWKFPASQTGGCTDNVHWFYCHTCRTYVSVLDSKRNEHYRTINKGYQRMPFANKLSETNAIDQHATSVKMLTNSVKDASQCLQTSGRCTEEAYRSGYMSNQREVGKENASYTGPMADSQCSAQKGLSESNFNTKQIHIKQTSVSKTRNLKKKSVTKSKIFYIGKKDTNGTNISNMKFIKDLRLKIQAKQRGQQSTEALIDFGDDAMSSIRNLQYLCDSVGKDTPSKSYAASMDMKAALGEENASCKIEADLGDAWAIEISKANVSKCAEASLFSNVFSTSNCDNHMQKTSDGIQSNLITGTTFMGHTGRYQPNNEANCGKSLVGLSGAFSTFGNKPELEEYKNPGDNLQDWIKADQPINLSMEACSSPPICTSDVGELEHNVCGKQQSPISAAMQSAQYISELIQQSYPPLETMQQSYPPLGTMPQSCIPVETITGPRVGICGGPGDTAGCHGNTDGSEGVRLYGLPDNTAESEFGTVLGEAVQGLLTLSSQESTNMN